LTRILSGYRHDIALLPVAAVGIGNGKPTI
jgi:hypothetical protein